MKNAQRLLIMALTGAVSGYLISKKIKQKDPMVSTVAGAIAGGITGIAINKLKEDKNELKLSLPQTIKIERT